MKDLYSQPIEYDNDAADYRRRLQADRRRLAERVKAAAIEACQHPHPEDISATRGRAGFYQQHIKHAWKQAEERVRALDLDALLREP